VDAVCPEGRVALAPWTTVSAPPATDQRSSRTPARPASTASSWTVAGPLSQPASPAGPLTAAVVTGAAKSFSRTVKLA